jgi:transketolase C-terminal domain/subunit
MKTLSIVLGVVGAGVTLTQAATKADQLDSEAVRRVEKNLVVKKTERINRITEHSVTYGGIAVAAVKAKNKLQLLNPVAPEEYGTAEDSVVRDPVTHNVSGLKIFSIKF